MGFYKDDYGMLSGLGAIRGGEEGDEGDVVGDRAYVSFASVVG